MDLALSDRQLEILGSEIVLAVRGKDEKLLHGRQLLEALIEARGSDHMVVMRLKWNGTDEHLEELQTLVNSIKGEE